MDLSEYSTEHHRDNRTGKNILAEGLRQIDILADGAIWQIKDKKYVSALEDYTGKILLVGINSIKDKRASMCDRKV